MLEVFFGLVSVVALIFIFTIHNYIKSYVAYLLGDDTPKRLGFLTLNPIPHIDIFGSIILPMIFILLKSPLIIGWPKLVPIDYNRFKNPRKAAFVLTTISIFTYFFVAFLGLLMYKLLVSVPVKETIFIPLASLFQYITMISTFIGFINLFPIPPLDMGIILLLLLGKDIREAESYFLMGSILILFLFISGFFGLIFQPIYGFLVKLF